MVDQPHTEQPPERKAPGKFSSTLLKIGSGLCFAGAAYSTYMGAAAIKHKGYGVGAALLGLGALQVGVGVTSWKHANFAGIVREANRRDELLLQRASINKELAEHSR